MFGEMISDQERDFLRIVHQTPRVQLEELLDELGLLDSFREAERGTE